MWCPPLYGKSKQEIKEKVVKRAEENKNTDILRKLVPKRFWKWKKVFGKKESEDTSVKDLELCHRIKGEVCTKKEEGLLIIKRKKRGGTNICRRSAKERIYSTL